ncbi:mandelate racemase/muconate lactonizing enzyme family protein [Marispirochaeta aestuarii]|uniref:mandelate racemase/muconate lactonizing enzyme family protein n=1 Tax=Marispirochaeta aestuarii TaxID=1963862 RepID=UPI0029C71AA5|nr:mandelate racemase/muconate lactonizing enzyme family protein [Marispirochaeta aestuarii]
MEHTIKDIRFFRAVSDLSKPIADSTHSITQIEFYVAETELENGVTGQGYLLAFHYSRNAIEGALQDIRAFVLKNGYKVYETVRLKQEYDGETEYFGTKGLQNWAGAIINVAMWDAWGRTLGVPVWKLLGAGGRRIPVYGSGGWLSYSDEELVDEVLGYKKRGFTAVKIKVGSELGVDHDLHRLRKCREALGGDIRIMMDANQGMDVPSALELSQKVVSLGIQWFEEPVRNTDYAGYEFLRNKCGIALAMGEREYDCEALKALIARNAIDMWQPDLIRIGGVEEWRNSAALSISYNIPVLPHYYKDYDVPLLCTVSRVVGAESFDWIDGIIDNKMCVKNGFAYPREGAGWGFSFKRECLEKTGA